MTAPLESDMALLAMVRGKCLVSEITCYWCGSKGYYKSDCPSLEVHAAAMAKDKVEDGV